MNNIGGLDVGCGLRVAGKLFTIHYSLLIGLRPGAVRRLCERRRTCDT
jgi:hypothetical protein